MYAQAMPKRRTLLPQPLMSIPLLMLMLLTECLPAKASGNYAISDDSADSGRRHLQSVAPKLLVINRNANSVNNKTNEDVASATESQQHQQQREPKTYRHFNISAYANDFNLQADATIPEDIFDQNDEDIEEDTESQLQFAEPFVDDADESEVADIILESQRPISRNFTVYLAIDGKAAKKKYHNNKNNIHSNSHYNYKLKNNKKSSLPKKAANEGHTASATNSTYGTDDNNINSGRDSSEESSNMYFSSKSFAYQKFKNLDEQENQQKQKEQQQHANANSPSEQMGDQGREQTERDGEGTQQRQQQRQRHRQREQETEQQQEQQEQLFDSVEILNERKLNKALVQSTLQASKAVNGEEDIMAIGDIADNFGNDEVLEEDIKSTIDSDESATTSKNNTTTSSSSAVTTTTEFTNVAATTTARSSSYQDLSLPIGRKKKRHGNGNKLAWVVGGRSNDNDKYDIGRIQAHNDEPQYKETNTASPDLEVNASDVGELHYYDGIQNLRSSEDSPSPIKSHANYLSNYFGVAINETKKQQQQQHDTRSLNAEDYTEDQMLKLESDTALGYRLDAVTSSPSAFERFKALRRNNRRNGHKTHKKRYKNYLKHNPTLTSKYALKLRKDLEHEHREREREWDQDPGHEQIHTHAAPIFALGVRPQRVTTKPFYEGQVNYYDNQEERQQQYQPDVHHSEMERLIATDNGIWYRRISPVLRNGVKTNEQQQAKHLHHLKHHHHKHIRQREPNQYQRKAVTGKLSVPPSTPPAPLPPPNQHLGHQITDLEQLERYYAKWPHLARVQFQVYDEHYRESHSELYPDYDTEEDYETAAELEEAQQDHGEEANLPPYIKKYNRRNKQLLNLLEGTLSPPTPTPIPTQPVDVWSNLQLQPIRLDDEYVKQDRHRYQQSYEDLFSRQRSGSNSTITPPTLFNNSTSLLNQLPDEDKQVEHLAGADSYWQKELATETAAALRSTPKPALFKLPLYPAIKSSFVGTPPRSRSAQFVANVAGRAKQRNRNVALESYATDDGDVNSTTAPPSSPLNSFVYHRVLDGIGGSSSSSFSRKQRLPFVAITDRRLDSVNSHKLLAERHKDYEQNYFPMP
ncbi:uncharacterized protein LOC117794004 [Drosophila innubila]|uniref:uncharacterized protein LOC117794004 n=1 Tax=Drosophila innubila TaxID=198719 RepID=UPI00148E2864|nr:uncharacterized protein LOC117794004 [Drosophila innubila]